MSSVPAEHWQKKNGVELVADDRSSVVFMAKGDKLEIGVFLADETEIGPLQFRADMAELLAEALTAWQGTKLKMPRPGPVA